jgi:hypothetical protein
MAILRGYEEDSPEGFFRSANNAHLTGYDPCARADCPDDDVAKHGLAQWHSVIVKVV